jgi:hypothetical protein
MWDMMLLSLAEWFHTFRRNVLPSSSRVTRSFAWTVQVLMTKTVRSFETLGKSGVVSSTIS